ncbi:MAG: alanine racemase [Acidobacteriota bacterium]
MKNSRRTFMKAAAAAAAATPRFARAEQAGNQTRSEFDPVVTVLPDNLRHNVSAVRRRTSGRPVMAMIKNNGYGLGLVNAARILEPLAGIEGFAVVKAQEAHALRDAGITKPVLLMGPLGENDFEHAASRDIRPMVYTSLGSVLSRTAAKLQRAVPIHVCVDTGIGRVGVPYREALPLIEELAASKSVRFEGIMMTFTEDPEFDSEQLQRFRRLSADLQAKGIHPGRMHAASSFALFQNPDSFLDMVRPGMVLYGVYPEAEFRTAGALNLRPALRFQARVIYVKQLRQGQSAGYNRAYRARQDVWVATLPIGHADGLPRAAANTGRVKIGGAMYPLIASVSASHSIAEIGSDPRVKAGDLVTVFDEEEGSRPEDFAAATGTSVYDLTMHLSALLPRVVATGSA